jgi:tRNA (mo5U34)-methyltransferase
MASSLGGQELVDRAADQEPVTWYHSIRLGNAVTPGICPPSAEEWTARALPADLTGKTVLDVGAWDGYFSFEAERRGASRVLAIDSLQGPEHKVVKAAGFEYAKAFLHSAVDFKVMDVADVGGLYETFDLIFFLGVYYHLHDPIEAFRLLFDRLRPGGLLVLEGLVLPGRERKLRLLLPEELEPTTYCAPTLSWLDLCLRQIGFDSIEVVGGTWLVREAMSYYADTIRSFPARLAYALANRVAWSMRLSRLPLMSRTKMYRGLFRATKPGGFTGWSSPVGQRRAPAVRGV